MEKKEEIIQLPSFPYKDIFGSLGIQINKSQIVWERCRDTFHNKTEQSPVDYFLFYHLPNTADYVINFIKTVESACKCPPDQVINFKKTSNANVLWVGLSQWWKYRVRRSLLTALLRCGQVFSKDTGKCFLEALNSQYYTSTTKDAVEAFLSGKTAIKLKKRDHFVGWNAYFQNKTKDQVNACLVRLKKKQEEASHANPV